MCETCPPECSTFHGIETTNTEYLDGCNLVRHKIHWALVIIAVQSSQQTFELIHLQPLNNNQRFTGSQSIVSLKSSVSTCSETRSSATLVPILGLDNSDIEKEKVPTTSCQGGICFSFSLLIAYALYTDVLNQVNFCQLDKLKLHFILHSQCKWQVFSALIGYIQSTFFPDFRSHSFYF